MAVDYEQTGNFMLDIDPGLSFWERIERGQFATVNALVNEQQFSDTVHGGQREAFTMQLTEGCAREAVVQEFSASPLRPASFPELMALVAGYPDDRLFDFGYKGTAIVALGQLAVVIESASNTLVARAPSVHFILGVGRGLGTVPVQQLTTDMQLLMVQGDLGS